MVVFFGSQLMTPMFDATVTLRVSTAASGQSGYASATFIANLLNTIANLATSNKVLNQLSDQLGLDYNPEVEYELIPNTELIEITVTDPNPRTAFDAAKAIGEIVISQGAELVLGSGEDTEDYLITQIAQVEDDILEIRKEYDGLLLRTPPAITDADLLYQELLLKQRNYDNLVTTLQDTRYANAMRANMITIIEQPEYPLKPASPNLILNMLIGGAGGLLFGVILAFILDSFDTTLFESNEIEKISGLKTFSKIPKVRNPQSKLTDEGNSAFAESFRKLALRILQLNQKVPLKVLLVVSGEPKQGKSMLVSHLALRLAEFGKKVVAVDCDLHLPRLHYWFGLPNTTGLSDLLEDDTDLDSAIQETNVENIRVITAGEKPKKTTLLLSSERMKELVLKLSDLYDFVLLDSPALLEVGDTEVISDCTDVFILVVRREEASREGTISASSYVQQFPDKLSLLVVNQEMTSDGYYYHPNGLGRGSIIYNIKRKLSKNKKHLPSTSIKKPPEIPGTEIQEETALANKKVEDSHGSIKSFARLIKEKITGGSDHDQQEEAVENLTLLTRRNLKKNVKTPSGVKENKNSPEKSNRITNKNLVNNLNSRLHNK
jgi:capsular exopolysaccharide synthesis family protein